MGVPMHAFRTAVEAGNHDAIAPLLAEQHREIHGCDFLRLDDAGLVEEFCVMVRPLSAATALSAAMAEQFQIIGRELRHGP